MKQLCGCCEGIEQVTPVSSVNRPGLSALTYRVGTHATFLESMLARVSLHSFQPQSTDSSGNSDPNPSPLRSLLTRESSDPAIAFLDAWAAVADVLTFYQERIANEGFLRTAVERRSVLELAWLIGYQLRPGVAASTYLAYTLDQDAAALIPAGTRAQSIPGPGELPQPFETAEDLSARGDWNLLQVRLTRPQVFTEALVAGKPIYFKGAATNLKEGDPLLVVFANPGPRLYRVIKVTPEPAADRTKVIVQDWIPRPTETAITPAAPQPITTLPDIIARHRDAETNFGINVQARMARRVLDQLRDLATLVVTMPNLPPADLTNADKESLTTILTKTLPPFREEHRLAREANFTKLEPWIGSLVSDLEQVLKIVSATNAPPAAGQSSLVQVGKLLEALETPPSQHPASSLQLGPSVAGVLSSESDALPKILTTLRPSLASMFYRAWGNLSVTPLPATQTFALRARASVYGNNAPLKPILDADGRIERYEEWTLQKPGERGRFSIEVAAPAGSASDQVFATTIVVAGAKTRASGSDPSRSFASNLTFNIALDNTEIVTVTVSNQTNTSFPSNFEFNFTKRNFSVLLAITANNARTVTARVTDPSLTVSNLTVTSEGGSLQIRGELELTESTEQPNLISLEASNTKILPDSWVVVDKPPTQAGIPSLLIMRVNAVREASRADYGISGKGTRLELSRPWISPGLDGFDVIRGTTVLAESDSLELAEEPIDPVGEAVFGNRIELADLVNGLQPGRWLIITGERADVAPKVSAPKPRKRKTVFDRRENTNAAIAGTAILPFTAPGTAEAVDDSSEQPVVPGVKASELIMLAGIEQSYNAALPGDKTHTTLLLGQTLAYRYKRDTVKIYGNVARATNGETRNEILGGGNASQALQSFTLRQSPLTFLSMPTPRGAESTLQVRVNDVLWHEVDSLAYLAPRDRNFVTKTDDESKTTIVFGNGERGARLPTGSENITALYRTGIGQPGNVKAGQITLLATKPLGVKEVINPLPATGGADREDRDDGRLNAPLAVMSLDRLVSTRDYEDFARTFAGVAKARAVRLSDGLRQLVHLTIAGADDSPISLNSDVYRNLRTALSRYGDPFQPIQIAVRFLKLLVVSANVRIDPDYIWESVEPKIRAAALDRFSFKKRELGQDVVLSEMIQTIQSIEGVVYVDVDTFDDVLQDITTEELVQVSTELGLYPRIRAYLAQVDRTAIDPSVRIRPAQLVLLSPDVKETLILKELKG
ncbi:MAG: putative baseplate assembly protein [Acidobacteriota bacterium]